MRSCSNTGQAPVSWRGFRVFSAGELPRDGVCPASATLTKGDA